MRYTDTYGSLTLTITGVTGNTIIQLMEPREKVLAEKMISKDGTLAFPLLEKGNYRLKAIYDLNGDGRWTTGDFKTKTQPEPVTYYPGDIEVRADFQIEQEWDLSKQNQKEEKMRTKKESGK